MHADDGPHSTIFWFLSRYTKAAKDLTNTENSLRSAEQQVNDLQARLNEAVQQRKHWENMYNVSKNN